MEYKNKTKKDLILIGYGLVKSCEIIKTKKPINNKNFELVVEKTQKEDKNKNKEA